MKRRTAVPLSRVIVSAAAITAAAALSACSHPGNSAASAPPSNPPGASLAASPSPSAATPPTIVGVTSGGALVTVNPTTGAVEQTLVQSGVLGGEPAGEVSVAPSGLVYFAINAGCAGNIEVVPITGGTPAVVAAGTVPAVSPDGTKLAYTVANTCAPAPDLLKIRALSSGATVSLPDLPPGQDGGLNHSISHLSWSADNDHVAVSILPPQDNEGYLVNLVDIAQAHYYLAGAGVVTLPVTGSPDLPGTVLGEGAYMPDGDLFVSRFCCEGIPPRNTSSLMWEVSPSGALVHQVAIGYPNLGHYSLDVSSDGNWLLYLAGTPDSSTLYVSQGGATPRELTEGLFAAAWS